jgi:hypothetical protein
VTNKPVSVDGVVSATIFRAKRAVDAAKKATNDTKNCQHTKIVGEHLKAHNNHPPHRSYLGGVGQESK